MEDGVLWTSSGTELSAREVASGSPAERAGRPAGRPAARDRPQAGRLAGRGRDGAARCLPGIGPDVLDPSDAGSAADDRRRRRADSFGSAGPLLRARGGRHLLAAGRRVRPAPAAGSPGDAALLLADRRVLRRAGVLVHRQARRPRLGVLLGGHHRAAAAAAAVPALRAGVPGSSRRWVRSDAGRRLLPLVYLPGAAARRRRSRGGAARARPTARCCRRDRGRSSSAAS